MMGKNKNNKSDIVKNNFDIKKNKAGCNLPNKKLEKILIDLGMHTSLNYVAKINNCSWETVKRIERDYKNEVDDFREQKRKEFLDDLWDSVRKALQIGDKKMSRALRDAEKSDDYNLRDLSTYIGTLIDKHQLLNGGATDRIEGDVSFSELAKRAEEYEEDGE
jgi:hypothetical protein